MKISACGYNVRVSMIPLSVSTIFCNQTIHESHFFYLFSGGKNITTRNKKSFIICLMKSVFDNLETVIKAL